MSDKLKETEELLESELRWSSYLEDLLLKIEDEGLLKGTYIESEYHHIFKTIKK